MSRDDIVRLGQSGQPWDFLPVVAQALRVAPDDAGLRVLAAANLARLGLRTLALEHLERVQRGVAAAADQLRAATESLPDDTVRHAAQTCRENAAALLARGADLGGALDQWCLENAATRWFRAAGGNVVRCRGESPELLGDHAGAARRLVAQHVTAGAFKNLYIEGVDPPWLLAAVAEALPRQKDGSWTRLVLVQADAMELLDGLALADLRDILAQERVHVLVGPDAAPRLERWFRDHSGSQLAGPCVPLHSVRKRVTPALEAALRRAEQDQLREHELVSREVRERYAGRDRAWWSRRYCAAGPADPLRVLVPTCRYSTYIQHASRDLVAALTRAGCRAQLLIEPDDASHFSSLAYLRAFAAFEPDLVVLVNYARANLGTLCPPEVPWVCWVQDAMPHQFSADIGRAQGPLDFIVGNLLPELFERYGFPRERSLSIPVVASAEKFHGAPVPPPLAAPFECDVAMLTHHSEPPEAMHARLCREAGNDPVIRRTLTLLFPRVLDAARRAGEASAQGALSAAALASMREAMGADPNPAAVGQIVRQYASPLADRALRHETLGWAADACDRRGWRLHLYGRGWESHPRFGACAKGEVEHGEPLRAAYQRAGVHLHASVTTLCHQRVMECALSGGLPLCRLTADAMSVVRSCAQRAAAASGVPPVRRDPERAWYATADNADLMAHAALLQRLGMNAGAEFPAGTRRVTSLLSRPPLDLEQRPDWLLVEPAETTFRDAAGLEIAIERALDSPGWRSGMSAAIAGRVRSRLTHDQFVRRVLTLVREGLA